MIALSWSYITTVCIGRRIVDFVGHAIRAARKLDLSQLPLQIDNVNRSCSSRRILPVRILGLESALPKSLGLI